MIKRISAISFVLLANIIILAHAVIPHHHHKSEVCFVNSHCQANDESHKHTAAGHDHEHDGNNFCQNCVLKTVVILPANHLRQEGKSFNCVDNRPEFDGFHAILFDSGLIKHILPDFSNTPPPLLSSSYSSLVRIGLGLRAPPLV